MAPSKLIVCEKPSVSQSFAATLGVNGRKDGYFENEEWIITWCVGHLVTMSYPDKYDPALKKWDLNMLPFLPEKYKYELIANTAKQFKIVKELLNRKDVKFIYNAGDAGREGEYIQRLTYMMAGYNRSAKMMRIWIDSQTDDEIRRGIREAKPASEYDNLSDAAYARGIEDFAMGINFSRALSCKFGYEFNKKIKSEKYKTISVGRVMTCVLGMVVDREREIRNFKPTPFYGIEAESGFASKWKAKEGSKFFETPYLYNETGFKEKKYAEKLLAIFNKSEKLKVVSVERKQEKKKAPLLFNLAELQNECSKKFKISPDETLEIAQKLYEARLTTYPRTDARVLSTPVAKEIQKNLSGLASYSHGGNFATEILKKEMYREIEKTQYTDDSKITDHYAIIPTGQINNVSLSDVEKQVYELIIDRFLSIFYPPAVYEKVEVVLTHPCKEKFYASEKILKSYGYLEVTGVPSNKQQTLAGVQEGTVLKAEFSISEGQTKPPSRYNSGSMILAMENAGNLIEDEELRAQIKGSGIGTSATRAEVLKKLVKLEYICLNSKTQIITPHKDGEVVYDIVKDNIKDLLSPKMTASWEKGLTQIANGEISKAKYIDTLNQYVEKHVNEIKGKNAEQQKPFESKEIGKCPICGNSIMTKPWGAACSGYKDECWFALNNNVLSVLNRNDGSQLQKLLMEGRTDTVEGFTSKKGATFSAAIILNRDERKVDMVFPEREQREVEDTDYKCPKCGKMLHKSGSRLYCDCKKFTFWTEVGSKDHKKALDDSQIQMLLDGLTIEVNGLMSKGGKSYSCNIQMKKDGKLNMIFPENKGKK